MDRRKRSASLAASTLGHNGARACSMQFRLRARDR
jgi:hypothetical protein